MNGLGGVSQSDYDTKKLEKIENSLKKLLHQLFRSDFEDLDFGIYKILNKKRAEIEKFIENDLIKAVEGEFEELYEKDRKDLEKEINDLKKKIKNELSENAIDEDGDLNPLFKETKLGKLYLEKLKELKNLEKTIQDKIEIFSRIYEFFSRYYVDGDLIPLRRYTKDSAYLIPYNGEEVTLYWANKDQYYVKTTEYFYKFVFRVGNYVVQFKIREAHIDKNNVKGPEKFFFLADEDFMEVNDNEITIYFEYRELTGDDYARLGLEEKATKSTIKEKLIEDAIKRINEELDKRKLVSLKNELSKKFKKKTGEETEKSVLEVRLREYVTRNTQDYFIHKDLEKFFLTELDLYIKNEFLHIDDIEKADEATVRKIMRRVRVFRNICTKIIKFLAEIENFEKMLWEKKKFVLQTEYVITLDKIKEYAGEEFLESIVDEILNNEKQLREWKELFDIEVKKKEDLIEKNTLEGKKWKKLPVDTKYFDEEFKWKLLAALSEKNDLDEILDGVLIKSENWQALNLLLEKYAEKVQTIYIDPPFNKEQEADYLYKVNYKDSTWITLLENRIRLARDLLNERGSIFVRCDYNGNMFVRMLLNDIFGKENFRNEIILRKVNYQGTNVQERFNPAHDLLYFYNKKLGNGVFNIVYKQRGRDVKWINAISPKENKEQNIIYIDGRKFIAPKGHHWRFSQRKFDQLYKEGRIRIKEDYEYIDVYGNKQKGIPQYLESELTPVDSNWTDISGYSFNWKFQTENSEILLKRVIESTSNEGDLVMDFFLGSGTTTAVAHKLGRKWIGVEMGEHFWTHVLPRMKKVLFYDKSGISKEKDVKEKYNPENAGGFFKYHTLEQYEDTLNNIIFMDEKERQTKLSELEDYIYYILSYGTQGSPGRLNIDQFKKPFDYKLEIIGNDGVVREARVDLVETFNYLLGLHVEKMFREKINGRNYVWVIGEKLDGSKTVIIWRDTEGLDLIQDKNYIESKLKELAGDDVSSIYVNGDSYVENAIPIEVEFMQLLGV